MKRRPAEPDLFAAEPRSGESPPVLSVSQITRRVREALQSAIDEVWVEGEISNHRLQPAGHHYFTLKDESAQLRCVMFKRSALSLRGLKLADGMRVICRGTISVYEPQGQYQLVVESVQAAGEGVLQARFEALKRKLAAEGLFDPARKRSLPRFPCSIGVVTSSTGAAIRDFLNVIGRRAPWIHIAIFPVRVQGAGAALEIAAAIESANAFSSAGTLPLDLLVVTRGGGSAEDLWEFNEESLARAIADSSLPVVSAVGHEIDFTIADFAADLRAPTPSAAAELVAPSEEELRTRLDVFESRLNERIRRQLSDLRTRLQATARTGLFEEPERRIAESRQRVDHAWETLGLHARARIASLHSRLATAHLALARHRPDRELAARREALLRCASQLYPAISGHLRSQRDRVKRIADLLRVLSPDATLARGYSLTLTEAGLPIDSVRSVKVGQLILTRLADGTLCSRVQ